MNFSEISLPALFFPPVLNCSRKQNTDHSSSVARRLIIPLPSGRLFISKIYNRDSSTLEVRFRERVRETMVWEGDEGKGQRKRLSAGSMIAISSSVKDRMFGSLVRHSAMVDEATYGWIVFIRRKWLAVKIDGDLLVCACARRNGDDAVGLDKGQWPT